MSKEKEENKNHFSILFDDDLYEFLMWRAKREGRSIKAQVRQYIKQDMENSSDFKKNEKIFDNDLPEEQKAQTA